MRAPGYDRAASDWYVEPRWSVDALLDVESFEGITWDPSCGAGNIPMAFRQRGMLCWGSDIIDRGFGEGGCLSLKRKVMQITLSAAPPYGLIEPYLIRALERTIHKVALLARLALLEGMKRQALFKRTPLARIWVSSRRISMPPGGSGIEAKGGSVAYAWFVWEHGYQGKAEIGWI